MTEQVQREVIDDGVNVQQRTKVTSIDDGRETSGSRTAANVVWFIAGVILVLLAFRVVFLLLAANQANMFANFIYTLSYPLAMPFFGLFGYSVQYGVSQLELSTLVAMAVYALVAYGIARLLTIRRAA